MHRRYKPIKPIAKIVKDKRKEHIYLSSSYISTDSFEKDLMSGMIQI